jgi:hypothetical protein
MKTAENTPSADLVRRIEMDSRMQSFNDRIDAIFSQIREKPGEIGKVPAGQYASEFTRDWSFIEIPLLPGGTIIAARCLKEYYQIRAIGHSTDTRVQYDQHLVPITDQLWFIVNRDSGGLSLAQQKKVLYTNTRETINLDKRQMTDYQQKSVLRSLETDLTFFETIIAENRKQKELRKKILFNKLFGIIFHRG